jgi:predicted TIM-barrel fold metal-dependent hydrolase
MTSTEEAPIELIDAQIHPPKVDPDWAVGLSAEQALAASIELAVASMDAVGVRAAVVNHDLEHVLAFVRRHPDRFAGVPFGWFADVPWRAASPDDRSDDERIAELAATPGIIGVRALIGLPDGERVARLRAGAYDTSFEAAQRHGLPLCITMHGFMPDLHPTIRAFPDLVFVLDHVGLYTPPFAPAGADPLADLPAVLEFAQYPNVVVKFTGVPSLSAGSYPFPDVWPPMHRLLSAFGLERCMWGSDFTRCAPLHNYRDAVDFVLATDELSTSDKRQLCSLSIRRWLRWPSD